MSGPHIPRTPFHKISVHNVIRLAMIVTHYDPLGQIIELNSRLSHGYARR